MDKIVDISKELGYRTVNNAIVIDLGDGSDVALIPLRIRDYLEYRIELNNISRPENSSGTTIS